MVGNSFLARRIQTASVCCSDRVAVQLRPADLDWTPTARPGISAKVLYEQADYPDRMVLERWAADTTAGARAWPEDTVRGWLADAGFSDVKRGTTLLLPGLMILTAR